MTTPLFPSVIAWNVLDGGTDAQDGNAYPGPALQDYAAAVVGAAGVVSSASATAVILGDSLVENGVVSNASSIAYTARNIGQTASALLNQRLRDVYDAGVSGNTLNQMLARFDSQVAPYRPAWVIVIGCSNDIDQDRTAAAMFSDITAIFNKARAIGSKVLFTNTSAGAYGSEARHAQWYSFHQMCERLHNQNIGFYYRPMYYGAVDCSTMNLARYAVAKSGMTYDGRHPVAFGVHSVYAKSVSEFFSNLFAGQQISSGGPRNSATGDQSSLVQNSWFAGSAGTPGTGITGSVPDAYSVSRTGSIAAVCAAADRTDLGPGRYISIDVSGAAAASDYVDFTSVGANSAGVFSALVGQTVFAEIDVAASASSGAINQLEFQLLALNSSSATLFTASTNQVVGTEYLGVSSFSGRMRTPPFVIPANSDRPLIRVRIGTTVGGAANFKMAGLSVRVV